jgi:mannose-6-phosphate isomerase-like protein (cupin superfamily)
MVSVGDRFENPDTGAILEIVRAPGDREQTLEVRRTIKPGSGKTIAHVHRDYVERFVVESGEALAKVDGRERRLGAGEELEVAIGQRHVNAYNASAEDLVMRHSFEPASDFALGYVETLGHLMRAAAVDQQGEVPVLAAFAIGHATGSRTYAAGVPDVMQRGVVFPLGAALGRLRGYDLRLPHVAGGSARNA